MQTTPIHWTGLGLQSENCILYALCISGADFTDARPAEGVSVPNLLSGLNCSGSEERLADCDHDGVNVVPTGCNRAFVQCITEGKHLKRRRKE